MNEENLNLTVPPTHASDLPALMQLAKELVPTGMLPDHIKTPGQAVAIILSGRELGLGPMLALRSIYMVKGKIELSADLQLSLFKRDGGQAKFTELTDSKAVLYLKHPNGDEHTETFSMEDAKRAFLNGDNWKKWPKAMLRSRAITAGLKSVGFEPKMSGCYAPGEIGGPEIVDVQSEPVTMTEPAKQPEPSKTNGASHQERLAAFAKWLYDHVGSEVAGWAIPYLQSHTPDGGEATSALMPNEDLTGLTEAALGAIRKDMAGFLKRLGEYAEANKPKAKPIEVPRDADATKKADENWWKEVEIHFGINKGTKLGDLDTKKLFGWWANWSPKEHPDTGEIDQEDSELREAFDACGAHYQFKSK